MSKTQEKQKAKEPTAKDILELMARLPATEKAKFELAGGIIPEGSEGIESPQDSIYGIPCFNCNKIALRLLGRSWGGQPAPPLHKSLREIAWTQDLVKPNRSMPLCQHCGAVVKLSGIGGLLPPDQGGFVNIAEWEAKIAQAYNPSTYARLRQTILGGGAPNLQGTTSDFEMRTQSALEHTDQVAVKGGIGVPGSGGYRPGPLPQAPPGHTAAVMEQIAEQGGLNEFGSLKEMADTIGAAKTP